MTMEITLDKEEQELVDKFQFLIEDISERLYKTNCENVYLNENTRLELETIQNILTDIVF